MRTYKRDILSSIDALLATPSVKSKLAVESGGALTMEINGRLVIPVQREYRNSVGIVHDASRSGKTCYVEPAEVVGPTNELRQAEAELRSEEARVWRQLTETIATHREEIERNVASLGQLDLVAARVKLGRRLGGVVPEVGAEGVVRAREARHPVLLLRGLEGVVGSDVEIGEGENQGLILTGPNSGGKTIILVSGPGNVVLLRANAAMDGDEKQKITPRGLFARFSWILVGNRVILELPCRRVVILLYDQRGLSSVPQLAALPRC